MIEVPKRRLCVSIGSREATRAFPKVLAMISLHIIAGFGLGLLTLRVIYVIAKVIDRVSCKISTGFDLH